LRLFKISLNEFLPQTGEVRLTVTEEYYSLVIEFHKWLLTRQGQIHSEEFKILGVKRQELRQLLIPSEVSFALGEIERIKNPDEAFYRLLLLEQREKLKLIPLKLNQHVNMLLGMIKQQAPISEELENKVKAAYQKYLG
jgi:hypothetical protein